MARLAEAIQAQHNSTIVLQQLASELVDHAMRIRSWTDKLQSHLVAPETPPPPPDPPSGSFRLLDLRHGQCRWPGPEDRAPWTFCGAPQAFDSSYCSEHHAMAHSRGSQRDYDRAAEQALAGKLFTSRAGIEQ
jgi:hypothetical protein